MNKRVLVPLDGSKLSELAIPHAVAYAAACGYGLTLLRIAVEPGPLSTTAWGVAPAANIMEGWDEVLEDEYRYLETIAGWIRCKGLEVSVQVVEDRPAEGIIAYAANNPEVALIAMSTHGRSGLGRWVFGSVTEQVLHASPVPLLLVHPRQGERLGPDFKVPTYRSLLVPVDGSLFAAQALDSAKALATAVSAKITLVSAVPDTPVIDMIVPPPALPREWHEQIARGSESTPVMELSVYLEQNRTKLESEGLYVETLLEYGPAADAILRVADIVRPNLIVMATHGRTGLPRLWLGSVAMRVVHNSTLPVLLVRTRERVKEPAAVQAAVAPVLTN